MPIAQNTMNLVANTWTCANVASAATSSITILPQTKNVVCWFGPDGVTPPPQPGLKQSGAFILPRPPGAILGGWTIAQIMAGSTAQYVWLYAETTGGDVVFAAA